MGLTLRMPQGEMVEMPHADRAVALGQLVTTDFYPERLDYPVMATARSPFFGRAAEVDYGPLVDLLSRLLAESELQNKKYRKLLQ